MEASTIAAILTGVLALVGGLATAWMSGWNENRIQERKSRKALARYSVPLLIAAWDLANWFYDILEEKNYNPRRCAAYGEDWDSQFTSYLIGQYFASVYVIREMTHFFANLQDKRADTLKKLLWKIQDEFVSMNYEERESLKMRWFEGDILTVQEKLTTSRDVNGDGVSSELQVIGWVDFQKMYKTGPDKTGSDKTGSDKIGSDETGSVKTGSDETGSESPSELKELFKWYEDEFQCIIYRRFKHLYSTRWKTHPNPQSSEARQDNEGLTDEEKEEYVKEDNRIKEEQEIDPNAGIVIPDHRVRRLQHLLSDLVKLLDDVSAMRFKRPVRRCDMKINNKFSSGNPLGLVVKDRVRCDCRDEDCNKKQEDFSERQLTVIKKKKRFFRERVSAR